MISRRAMLAGMGGLPFTRPDQHYEPPAGGAQIPGARGLIRARAVIIAGSPPGFGLLVYTPTVGAGNLIDSISLGGSDGHTNTALADIVNYALISGNYFAVRLGGGAIAWYSGGPSESGPWTQTSQISGANSPDLTLQSNRNIVMANALLAQAGLTVTGLASITGSSGSTPMLDIINTLTSNTAALRIANAVIGDTALNIKVTGDTAGRIEMDTTTVTGLPRIKFGPGNATQDSLIRRDSANLLTVQTADWDVASVGRGLRVAEGTNAKQGTATLAAGSVIVANTAVTANSRIFLTAQTSGAAPGALRVSARTAGTSFTITSTSATDTSLVAYEIFEPG